jgi:predicted dehydrogenase
VSELLDADTLGDIRMLTADFGFHADFDPKHRLFAPELGGGALLDVGIYPVALASMLFGQPAAIASQVHLGETGVDEQSALVFKYADGQLALLSSAIRTETPQEACIMGTKGLIRIPSRWWMPQRFSLHLQEQAEQVFELPFEGNGYNYEAAEVMRCLRAGLKESQVMPLDETLATMRTLDAIRAQWGLTYPGE